MSANPAITVASTLQSASINRAPLPTHDINPSTAASSKQPVRLSHPHSRSPHSHRRRSSSASTAPSTSLAPVPRRAALPPLPDLRFEQSYLASIRDAQGVPSVLYITVRDQVILPLLQGTLWTLALAGWRFWNRGAAVGGRTVGGRVREWWWGVNGWDTGGAGEAAVGRGEGLEEVVGGIGTGFE